ncbi:MAG: GFA family protein [Pseudomonadales bacterium]|nr:GFA family protein [Pseudomonadales bacterium]
MIEGSCLCGNVTYKITSKISDVVHCHCVTCRKAHGSAFSSVASVPIDGFELKGRDQLNRYESSSGKHRFFCKTCGTQVYAKRDKKSNIILRLGSLDTPIPSDELAHTWVSHSVEWFDIDGDLPKYDKGMRGT